MAIYRFNDGEFEFFTAVSRRTPSYVIIYRVRTDTWPEKRAREKSIAFDYIRPSSVKEIGKWMETHPDFQLEAGLDFKMLGTEYEKFQDDVAQEALDRMETD